MKKLADLLSSELELAFEKAGYDKKYARVTLSNRPDLCEYQCNGAMAAAKEYKKAPFVIAGDVAAHLGEVSVLEKAEVVNPGFVNLTVGEAFLADYLSQMDKEEKMGVEEPENPQTIVIDYGGANVAKALHVGHLRPAIIGESVKRIGRFAGHRVIGDVHLGDWGSQMGLVMMEVKRRQPDLPYFDDSYEGEYPTQPPFTIEELGEIYPTASAYAKENEEFKEAALQATYQLQNGHRGYTALWRHIMDVSLPDLKENYRALNVEFDLWKGESDAKPYIADMVQQMKDQGYAREDQGALVVDVKEDTDTKEVPPCMILKSDGASLYATTDLATLIEREQLYHPDQIIYVTDKRQEMHFVQVFRCAKKTGIVPETTLLRHIGFGTMNGRDGKPFKTRDGGVMCLKDLLADINDKMYEKIAENDKISEEEARQTARRVGLSAVKYGDLSNQAAKDYVFDVERFVSFEGNTGPYILYNIVRMKSILKKYEEAGGCLRECRMQRPANASEKALMLEAAKFNSVIEGAYEELAPHKICAYLYDLANAFSRFYHETKILTETDEEKKAGFIALIALCRRILETCIDLLGFEAPERM